MTKTCIMSSRVILCSLFISTQLCLSKHLPSYAHYNLLSMCPPDGSKKTVSLGTKPAIFSFVANRLTRDFTCHLELEVPSRHYGFHVFFDEMNLVGNETGNECIDYVQFARDDLIFTVHKSPLYCGQRRLINSTDIQSYHKAFNGRQTRFYIEEKDSEMDFWLKLAGSRYRGPRNLTVTVTVFKKFCKSSDRTYAQCKNTQYCIKKEYFCDLRTNCAWPNGDYPTDEQECEGEDLPSTFTPGNIPIIIIVIIVVLGILIVFFVAVKTFYKTVRRSDRDSGPRRRHREAQEMSAAGSTAAPPLLLDTAGENPGPPSAPPTQTTFEFPRAPPTYDEAVKTPPPDEIQPSSPPPYSAT